MRTSRTIVPVLLAITLLGGCGDNRSADQKAMTNKFEKIDYEISRLETVTSAYNTDHFINATQRYIALVRQYHELLGPAERMRTNFTNALNMLLVAGCSTKESR
jgi:outer membrane murein-binding lipoprotein Lpp